MNILIDKEVTKLFPGLRVYMVGPIQAKLMVLSRALVTSCKLSSPERAAYTSFRKKREALANSHFLLAVETYVDYRAPDATIESQVRQLSADTSIPLGILPATIFQGAVTLRLSKTGEQLETPENSTITLPTNSLVLVQGTKILGHFSVRGSRHLKLHGDDPIYILSYLPDNSVSKDKIQTCLKRLKEQFQV